MFSLHALLRGGSRSLAASAAQLKRGIGKPVPVKSLGAIVSETVDIAGGMTNRTSAAPQMMTTAQQRPPSSASQAKNRKNAGKLHFDASKAGLQKVDKAYVEHVIQEASKGTAFYQKEQRKEELRRKRIGEVVAKAAQFQLLSPSEKQAIQSKVDHMVKEMEAARDVRRRYIHIDMDMFYAAVEEKKNPNLRDIPFGVGTYAMLATTNYIARQYGVRSGMPGFIGKKLCPDLIIVPTDFAAYRQAAARVHNIAMRYDANFVSLGLDELTMDVTRYLEEFPHMTAAQVAEDFREEVYTKTKLTCSAGVAPTSALAKIASNVNKPNGQHEIVLFTREEVLDYVKDIPLRQVPGVGYVQELTLNALKVRNCGDLLSNRYLLYFLFKEKTFRHYLTVGLGLMEAHAHKQHATRKSIGKESSFSDPLPSPEAFVRLVRQLIVPCHAQCVRDHLLAQQMCLVTKYRTYDTTQFSIPLPRPTNDLKLWLETAQKLIEPQMEHYDEFRLVGIRLQKLISEGTEGTASASSEGRGDDTTFDLRDEEGDNDALLTSSAPPCATHVPAPAAASAGSLKGACGRGVRSNTRKTAKAQGKKSASGKK